MKCARSQAFLAMAFVVLIFAAAASGQSRRVPQATPTPERSDEPIQVATEEIKLNVLAFDENGKFVRDVGSNDLVITDNNIINQPSSVRRIPANVVIVMDTGGEMRQVKSLDQTRKTAASVVNSLKPDDSVSIIQYNDKAEVVSEWTTDKEQSLAAIKRAGFGRHSAFASALRMATDLLQKNPTDNRHLVLITDGTDSGKSSAKYDAIRHLLSTDISVHVISYTRMESADIEPRTKAISNTPPPRAMPPEVAAQLPNGARDVATAPKSGSINLDRTLLKKLRARKADLDASEKTLSDLAENTNGEFILPTGLDEMVEKSTLIGKVIDAGYVVTYTPKVALSEGPSERLITVTSKRPDLIVQAKRKLVRPENR